MKIIALEHERAGAWPADNAARLEDEARAVWHLAQAGVVREIFFRQDRPQAVIVLEAESVEAAQDILARLPLVQAGLIEFEVIGLRPYPGYARLFAS
jgi:muconolactone delta-isomerase